MHFWGLVCGREQKGTTTRRQVKATYHLEEGALEIQWDNGIAVVAISIPLLTMGIAVVSISVALLFPSNPRFHRLGGLETLDLACFVLTTSKLLSWLWLGVLRPARNALMWPHLLDHSGI
jgi:hypothetical protein